MDPPPLALISLGRSPIFTYTYKRAAPAVVVQFERVRGTLGALGHGRSYGAITYYLAHREAIEAHLREQEAAFEALKETLRRNNPQMAERIAAIKQLRQTARP
jgi:hypothetical protein